MPVSQQIDCAQIANVRHRQVCKAIQRRLDIQRTEQACRIRQKERAAQQLFPFRDIAEAPYPSDNLMTDTLRNGIALEYAAVLEMKHIETVSFRIAIERAYAAQEIVRA